MVVKITKLCVELFHFEFASGCCRLLSEIARTTVVGVEEEIDIIMTN